LGRSHPVMRLPDRPGSQTSPGITEHRPNIFRAFPGISGHRRTRNDHRVPYRPSPGTPSRMARRGGIARRRIACDQARRMRYRRSPDTASGMVVACRIARRRTQRRGWSSRAVSLVAGSCAGGSVARSRLVMSRPVSAISCLCRGHGRASRTPVVCHVPAQHGAGADAATGSIRTFILLSGRGVLSWRVRRRGSAQSLGGPQPETPMSNVYSARVKTRRFLKWRFTVSLRGKAALQERPRISRAEYNQTRIDLQSL
jgi:hypothetical protein